MTSPNEIILSFDDEHVGGDHAWREYSIAGCVPRAGDLVWNPDDGTGWEVVRVAWTFVRPSSPSAQAGIFAPHIRVHVKPGP